MLKDTLLKFFKLDGLISNLSGYVETRIELLKYEIKEDMAKAITRLMLVLLFTLFFTFFILFISVSIAYKIGERVGTMNGFVIVAGFYLVLMLIIVFFRGSISKIMEEKIKEHITHRKQHETGNRRPDKE